MRYVRFSSTFTTLTLAVLLMSCAPAAQPAPTAGAAKEPAEVTKSPTPLAPVSTPKPAAAEPKYGGVLNIAHPADPLSYDPVQETSLQSVALLAPAYSALVQHDPLEPTKVIGDLAEKWDMSPDGLTYTFQLSKNVKWHDGAPFTSEDARFTLETVRKPPRGVLSPRAEFLKPVDKIEAPDRDTLRITLQYPSASFIHNLGDGAWSWSPSKSLKPRAT